MLLSLFKLANLSDATLWDHIPRGAQISTRPYRNFSRLNQQFFHLLNGLLGKKSELHGNLFEYHVILRQCSCLISQQELNSAQLLRNGAVADDAIWDNTVVLYQIAVVNFGKVKVNPHGNWYNRTE